MSSVFKILSFAYVTYPFKPSSPVLHTLQSTIPASEELIADFNSAYVAGEEKLTTFLQDRVFSKKISLHENVLLKKHSTFAKESSNEKPREGPQNESY